MTTMELNFINSMSNWATAICAAFIVIGSLTLLVHVSPVWTVLFFAVAWYTGAKGSQRDAQAVNLWLHFLGGAGFWASLLICMNV